MEPTTAICSGVALILAFFFLAKRVLIAKKIPNLNLPPTIPWSLPIIGHLHLLKPPLHLTFTRLAARHGPLLFLRLGAQPIVVISSPDLVEECFTKNDIIFSNRPNLDSLKTFSYNFTTIAAAPYGPHWLNLRRLTAVHLFSTARIDALSHSRSDEVRHLVIRLFQGAKAPGFHMIQLKSQFKEMLVNVLMRAIVGNQLDDKRLFLLFEEFFRLMEVSNVEDYLPFVRWLGLNGPKKQLMKLHEEMDNFFQEMVDEQRRRRRRGEGQESKGLLDVMLDLQETDGEYYTDQIIKGVIQALLSGNTESSAGVLEWAMSLLLNNPSTLKKLRAEIETQVGHKRLVADSDLPNLPYLTNVIKETLRMFPVAPLLVPRQSSSECMIRGYDIPAKTLLFVNVFAMNKDPMLWSEPTKFKPERFESREWEGYNFVPFGSGRRRCPGDAFALRVVRMTLGSLIQCFEWERVGEMEVDLTGAGIFGLFKADPLQAMYKPQMDMINMLSQL